MSPAPRIRDLELIHRIVEAARDGDHVKATEAWSAEHIDYNIGLAIDAGLLTGQESARWYAPRYDNVEPTNMGHDFLERLETKSPAWHKRFLTWAADITAREGIRAVIQAVLRGEVPF